MTNLDFEVPDDYEEEKLDQLLGFVDRNVLLQYIPLILRFRLSSYLHIDSEIIDRWICALVRNKIQELVLSTPYWSHNNFDLSLPESLFSCKSLVVLKLNFHLQTFVLNIPARVCLPRLKVLHIGAVVFPNNGCEERLFLSCPVLEVLVLMGCSFDRGITKFKVSNQSLKRLTLKYNSSKKGIVLVSINAPSLVFFNYFVTVEHSLELVEVKSLVEAVIDSPPGLQHVTPASSLLSRIKNIQKLNILSFTILKDLHVFNVSFPLFNKMTCLNILDWQGLFDPISLEYFLARCVVLETLVFEETAVFQTERITEMQLSLQKSRLGPLLSHLKTFKIKVFDLEVAECSMSVIEFFLENAQVLEKLEIHSKRDLLGQKSKIMDRILSFPRVSEKCSVLLLI